MGITSGKTNKGLPQLPATLQPVLKRRNSLPPLLPRQISICHESEVVEKSFVNQKLPVIRMKESSDAITSRLTPKNSSEDGESFRVIDCGLEEAGGVGQTELPSMTFYDEEEEEMIYFELKEISHVRHINLSDDTRKKLRYFAAQDELANNKQTSSFKSPDDVSVMEGRKTQFQPRPMNQKLAPRPIIVNRHKILPTNTPQRPQREDIMVSMEERLAKSAKAKKNSSTSKSKSKKSKRAKTASNKTRIRKNLCLLTCIKPQNLEIEKAKFMKSGYSYNPQFKYEYPASENVLTRYSNASSTYIPQALAIMHRVLEKYGNYERFEWATGGYLLTKTQLWKTVKKYLEKEGFYGEVVVNISNDLIARAAMTVCGGRPTLNIRESAAKRLWVEGLLRHEIGTHHLRFHNNRQQVWHNMKIRRQMGLKPANPTEEGLASLHSVLLRKDPLLWRSAILYYTVYKASQMSFCDLFEDLGQFVDSPEVRWDYCLRSKRGLYDTSKPGCFNKDQVYLTGILQILQIRHRLDFHLLCTMGKISHEDIEMLKPFHNTEHTKIPSFMKDIQSYRSKLDLIVDANGLEEYLKSEENQDGDNDVELSNS